MMCQPISCLVNVLELGHQLTALNSLVWKCISQRLPPKRVIILWPIKCFPEMECQTGYDFAFAYAHGLLSCIRSVRMKYIHRNTARICDVVKSLLFLRTQHCVLLALCGSNRPVYASSFIVFPLEPRGSLFQPVCNPKMRIQIPGHGISQRYLNRSYYVQK